MTKKQAGKLQPVLYFTCNADYLLGDPPRNRTVNLLIKSQLLCQLS